MKTFRIVLYMETGNVVTTTEAFEATDEDDAQAAIEEEMQDRGTGPWKRVGNVSFIWKRLVAFEIEEIRATGDSPQLPERIQYG